MPAVSRAREREHTRAGTGVCVSEEINCERINHKIISVSPRAAAGEEETTFPVMPRGDAGRRQSGRAGRGGRGLSTEATGLLRFFGAGMLCRSGRLAPPGSVCGTSGREGRAGPGRVRGAGAA